MKPPTSSMSRLYSSHDSSSDNNCNQDCGTDPTISQLPNELKDTRKNTTLNLGAQSLCYYSLKLSIFKEGEKWLVHDYCDKLTSI